MAEILLSGVLRKLAGFTVEKVLQLSGVNEAIANIVSLKQITKQVEELKEELSWIRGIIEDADQRCIVDKTHKTWLANLMEIAYQIEDALDIFFLKCPTVRTSPVQNVLSFGRRSLDLQFFYEFQQKLIEIREKVSKIQENRKNYDIKSLGVAIEGHNTQSDRGRELDPIKDPDVVGFGEAIKEIVKNLCDKKIDRLAVVSIVGPGGLGKTTIAQKVRCSEKVRKEFGESVWVTISQTYDLRGVLTKIAKGFGVGSADQLDKDELAKEISNNLTKRKYLIILDDVWTKKLWNELSEVLPDANNGSRVLITTRLKTDVAKYADSTFEPYEPPVLSDSESRELFLKNAIPKTHQSSEGLTLSPNLNELAAKFIDKCKGLPLALIVLGRLLCTIYNYHGWKNLLDTMNWRDDGIDECTKIIATSYEHLPFARKFCFMYFAAFPEDKPIEVQRLLWMWVAEKLIPPEKLRTLEQTAEHILEDLVQRSMVQVDSRDHDGSIKCLRVHDILRDLAIEKAKESRFLVVCSKQDDWQHCEQARRVAVHYSNFNESMQANASRNLRSLIVFGRESNLECSKYRLLRVLAVINEKSRVELQGFKGLSHLRYFELNEIEEFHNGSASKHARDDIVKWLETHESIEALRYQAKSSRGYTRSIWKSKTLRHVEAIEKTEGPPGSADLPDLQTLRDVHPSLTWSASNLPNIPQLRELRMSICNDTYPLKVIAALLRKVNHLVTLSLFGHDILQKLQGQGVFPCLENLKQMYIANHELGSTLELKDNMLTPNLTQLCFYNFEFKSDPMLVLENLSSLKALRIKYSNRTNSLEIKCSAGGFKQLELLSLKNIDKLQEWELQPGAMPLLKRLKVDNCELLPVPQPQWFIGHKTLRFFDWRCTNTGLTKANEDKILEILKERPDLQRPNYSILNNRVILHHLYH